MMATLPRRPAPAVTATHKLEWLRAADGQTATLQIVQRDDGKFEIGIDGAGPFPSRRLAETVAAMRRAA